MTDFKPQYQSDRLEIFEWPQPICELRDPSTGQLVSIRTPEDATAVIRSLKQFIAITNQTSVVDEMEEKAIITGAQGATVLSKLQELHDDLIELGYDKNIDPIAQTLDIVESHFHLVPKVTVATNADEDMDAVVVSKPKGVFPESLTALWVAVNS